MRYQHRRAMRFGTASSLQGSALSNPRRSWLNRVPWTSSDGEEGANGRRFLFREGRASASRDRTGAAAVGAARIGVDRRRQG